MKTVIIGAGLSGLSLAQALLRAGVNVSVFERDIGVESRGQGYRLTIDEIGSYALKTCLPDANYQLLRSTAGTTNNEAAFIFLDEKAREMHRFVFNREQDDRLGRITGQVDRRTLRKALLSGVEKSIRWEMSFSQYEESSSGVTVHFEDGSSVTADLLIGADGSNSRVRKQLLPNLIPGDTGSRAIFGRTLIANRNLPIVEGLLSQGGAMSLGPRGRVFFCTAMRFREQPALAAKRLGINLQMPYREDYVMWAVVVPKAALGGAEDRPLSEALHQIALHEALPFEESFRALVQNADQKETVLVPLRALSPSKPWHPRRVTLIGDAVHVMPPFGAHGANTALKDAQILSNHLLNRADTAGGLAEQIGAYEAEMRVYGAASVREALRMTTMATAHFPFKKAVFRTALKLATVFSNGRQEHSLAQSCVR
jgi:2-polyprenyl-6-methoxyphenol hydroxylase-like FAD-dependent oxidoreductase